MELKKANIPFYVSLTRLDKPIGILLLLWPTLWGLWLAAEGVPSIKNLIIFVLGVVLMRSAGCVINDYADRDFDGQVNRTKERPLALGKITETEALTLFWLLSSAAFFLVLFTNWLTVLLSFGGVVLAACYPFMKRYTYFPQVVLGAAFSWSVIMAFGAETKDVVKEAWLIYIAVLVWTVVYDTFYAMVDRECDLKAGIKSTAILFGDFDKVICALLQLFVVFVLFLIGYQFKLEFAYFISTIVVAFLFLYQQVLIQDREPEKCFKAFKNNHWVGFVVFIGIVLDYAFKG